MNELTAAQADFAIAEQLRMQAEANASKARLHMHEVELRVKYGIAIGDTLEWTEPKRMKSSSPDGWHFTRVAVPAKTFRGKVLSYDGWCVQLRMYKNDGELGTREQSFTDFKYPERNVHIIKEGA